MGSKVSQNNQIIWRSASSSSSLLKLEQSNRRSLVLAQISVDRGEERHLYQPTCLSIYPPTYLLIYLPTYLSIYYLPTYLSTYIPTYLSIYTVMNHSHLPRSNVEMQWAISYAFNVLLALVPPDIFRQSSGTEFNRKSAASAPKC